VVPLAVDAVCTENEHYPEFVDRAVTVSVSPSLRRGDVVALLEARDADWRLVTPTGGS